MKKLLLVFLMASNAMASPFFDEQYKSMNEPIDAAMIRNTFQRLWSKAGDANHETLEKSLKGQNGFYKNVATCVWESSTIDKSGEIFFAAISLGIQKQIVGPFEHEFLSFNYLKHRNPDQREYNPETIRFSDEEELKSSLYKLGNKSDLLVKVETYNRDSNDGAFLKDTESRNYKVIQRMRVKPIVDAEGLKGVSYLLEIDYGYYCIL